MSESAPFGLESGARLGQPAVDLLELPGGPPDLPDFAHLDDDIAGAHVASLPHEQRHPAGRRRPDHVFPPEKDSLPFVTCLNRPVDGFGRSHAQTKEALIDLADNP